MVIRVRVRPQEYEIICKKAEMDEETRCKSGKRNLSAYLRKCILRDTKYVREETYRKEIRELTYQVRKIGVNINQIVKQMNRGYQSQYAVKELMDLIRQVNDQFEKTQERFQQIDGGDITSPTDSVEMQET